MTDLFIDNEGNVSLSVAASTLQHQRDVVLANKGHFRFFPVVGVGITAYLNDNVENPELSQSVRIECGRAQLPPASVTVLGSTITLTT